LQWGILPVNANGAMQRRLRIAASREGTIVNKKLICAALGSLALLSACNHNTQGADNVLSVADNKADAMQDNASALRDEANNMGGAAANKMDNAAAALDNRADQVRSDAANQADALNNAVKK
jgi:hypothetical protein